MDRNFDCKKQLVFEFQTQSAIETLNSGTDKGRTNAPTLSQPGNPESPSGPTSIEPPTSMNPTPPPLKAENLHPANPMKRASLKDHRLFQVLSVEKTQTSPPLWMNDGRISSSAAEKIQLWHRGILKPAAMPELSVDVAQTVAEVAAKLESDSKLAEDSLSQSKLNAAAIGLGASYCVDQCHEHLPASEFENFQSDLWSIVAYAESASSVDQLLTKSMGIELAATLCIALQQPDEASNRFIVQEFEALIEAKLDGDGWPTASLLSDFGMLAGSWVRSYKMIEACEVAFDPEIALQMEWLVRQAIRMRRNGHRLSFSNEPLEKSGAKAFWQSLLSVTGDVDDLKLFQTATSEKASQKSEHRISPAKAKQISDPFNISEWGKSAVLRSTWSPKSPKLAIDFSTSDSNNETGHPQFRLDLGRTKELIIGNTMPEITFNGCQATPSGEAEVVCERCDEDLDYLEIQVDIGAGGRLNRQFILSRTDEFFLVIDTICPTEPGQLTEIDYRCEYPLASGIEGLHEHETREVYLQTSHSPRKIQALILPLSLPEWNVSKFDGKLTFENERMVLKQLHTGHGLCIPLAFDLNPKRSRKKRTWRQLTVQQDRQPVPPDHGCAFRFQFDKSQWFFYRSVATLGNRTFLGQNTISEFVFFKFNNDGSVSELIDVK